VNPAEIVIGEVQAVCSPQVVAFLAECICEPRQAAHLHSDSKIVAFDNRRTDSLRVRVTDNRDHLHGGDFSGAVTPFAFGVVFRTNALFRQLPVTRSNQLPRYIGEAPFLVRRTSCVLRFDPFSPSPRLSAL